MNYIMNFIDRYILRNKHYHMTWMRANPPHKGHEAVIKQVQKYSLDDECGYGIYVTTTHDFTMNPLPPPKKLDYINRAFPLSYIIMDFHNPSILQQASNLYKNGITHLHLHFGADRAEKFWCLLHQYNGVGGKHGYYKFKKIEVHQVGDYVDREQYSGTKMRRAVKNNDYETFANGCPLGMPKNDIYEMFHDIRRHLK